MKHISLFSGIGGFDLAAQWARWENILSCEINPFGRRVLEYYWPYAYHHDDIKTLTYGKINEELTKRHGTAWHSDDIVLSGGFPCQPYSLAGKRKGKDDDRHLWPEMLRVIRELRPRWIVGENVFGIVNWNRGLVFEEVQAELEAEGYEVQTYILPACGVGAPHRRDRVWFVAHKNAHCDGWNDKQREERASQRKQRNIGTGNHERLRADNGKTGAAANPIRTRREKRNIFSLSVGQRFSSRLDNAQREQGIATHSKGNKQRKPTIGGIRDEFRGGSWYWEEFPTQSPVCIGNDGVPPKLDGITVSKWRNETIKAAGNAVVPQLVFQIFKAINEYENKFL